MTNPKDTNYTVGGEQYKPPYQRDIDVADPEAVRRFHSKADTDSSQIALHHTIGSKHDQSAAGDHKHIVGSTYSKPLAGVTLTGAKGGNAALASVITALVKLGATDSTTA